MRAIVAYASDDLLMVRHPTRHRTFLSVATREEGRRAVALSADPRVIFVYGGVPTGQAQLLTDLAATFDITLPRGSLNRSSAIVLAPSGGGTRSVLVAEMAWIGPLAVVHESEGGTLDRDWHRQDVDSRSYLRGLVGLAA